MVVLSHVFLKICWTRILIGVELEPTLTWAFTVQCLELWQNVDVVEQEPEAATNLMVVLQVLRSLSRSPDARR